MMFSIHSGGKKALAKNVTFMDKLHRHKGS